MKTGGFEWLGLGNTPRGVCGLGILSREDVNRFGWRRADAACSPIPKDGAHPDRDFRRVRCQWWRGVDPGDRSSRPIPVNDQRRRSEEHTSELQSLMRISYAVFCLKKKNKTTHTHNVT